jgi:hypothetical protein
MRVTRREMVGRYFGLLALLAFIFCPTVVAQERNGWELDSLRGNPNVSQLEDQQVYEVLLKILVECTRYRGLSRRCNFAAPKLPENLPQITEEASTSFR